MALTKVTGQVIKNTTDVTVGVLTVTNTLAVGGTVSIGGTLTYEDVTNVDAVGLITARNGIVVGSGITLSKDGDVFFTGIATGNGSGLTAINASNISSGTVPTARLGSGTASSSTFLRGDSTFAAVTSTTINNNADNRVITGSGTANTLNGESTLTYNGIGALNVLGASGNTQLSLTRSDANTSGTTGTIGFYASDNHAVAGLYALGDGDNEGAHLVFKTTSAASGTSVYSNVDERLRITSDGKIGVNVTTPQKLLDVRGEFAISNSNTSYWDFDRDDSDGSLKIKDTGTERLRITSAGRLGVGIVAPTKLLDIATATSADGIRIRSTGNTYNELSFDANRTSANTHISRIISHWNGTAVSYISMDAGSDTTNKDDGMIRFWTANGSGNYERLRIASDGKIGINESSPANYGIHASQSSQSVYYRADSGSVDSIYGSATSLGLAIAGTTSNHPFVLYANNAERLRIDSGGDIGINVTNPGSRLAIYDADGDCLLLASHNYSGETRIGFTGNQGTGGTLVNGATTGAIGVTASAPGGAATGYMSLYTNAGDDLHEAVRIAADNTLHLASTGGDDVTYSVQTGRAQHSNSQSKVYSITGLSWGQITFKIGVSDGNAKYGHFAVLLGGMMWAGGNGYNATVIANDASGVNISINKQDGGYHITIANAGNSNTIFGAWQLEASLYSNLGKPTLTIS